MNDLIKAALEYRGLGYSVVPVRYDKRSVREWKQYQQDLMSEQEIIRAFGNISTKGIAIVCGDISGHLEVIDTDSKNDLSNSLFDRFSEIVDQQLPGFIHTKTVLAATRNNGYHILYRCPEIGRNTILARRPATEVERLLTPEEKVKILMETRANGGYVLVAPSPGYRFFQGDLRNVSFIQPVEREALFAVARSFNSYSDLQYERKLRKGSGSRAGSPLDDYDRRGNVVELLKKHGWIVVRESTVRTEFRRPGQTDHDTSGDFHHGLNLFGVFTTSTMFKPETGYSPSAVYALLECNGDFSLAAKRLIEDGYGTAYRRLIQ